MSSSVKYRPDIDGLRAIAVLPVMLFHARIPGFSGGYVGVDVFFVISGFLITSMIAEEMSQARFSIVRFYERRVRRIFPALFSVLIGSSVAAWFILTPGDLKDFGQSVLATAGFGSNVLFWLQTDYFDGPAHMKPLLHTWSLAVEEQFYIVFPLILAVLKRFHRARVAAWVSGLLVVSLASSWFSVTRNPASAFYLSPHRGWELLVGCVIALGAIPTVRSARARDAMAAIGVAMIGCAVVLYTDETPFPGAAALLPCIGAGLVIHTGVAGGSSTVGSWLSRPGVVFIGKISYSLYLWHWPLLVLGGYLNTERLGVGPGCAVLLASIVLSALSWRYIEQPFRHGALRRRSMLFGVAVAVSVLAMAFGGALHVSGGVPSRVAPIVTALDDARKDRNPDRSRCHASDDHPVPFDRKCVYGAAGAAPSAVIWGDSFAAELAMALGEQAKGAGRAILYASYSACAPAIGVYAADRPKCDEHNREMLARLVANAAIRDVVLVSRHQRHYQEFGDAYLQALGGVARALREAGKRVVVTYPIPKPPAHVPTMLAQYAHLGRDPADAHIDRAAFDRDNAATVRYLDGVVGGDRLIAARPADILCRADRCDLYVDGKVLYFDENHLSLTGARHVLPIFAPIFEEKPR